MHERLHVRMHVRTHAHMRVRMHAHMHVRMHALMHVRMHVRICVPRPYVHMYIHSHISAMSRAAFEGI